MAEWVNLENTENEWINLETEGSQWILHISFDNTINFVAKTIKTVFTAKTIISNFVAKDRKTTFSGDDYV